MKKNKSKRFNRYTEERLFRRNLRFWLVWLALVALIAVGIMRIHAYFDKNLRQYEASQYEYLAEDAGKIFTERRFDELYSYEKTDADYLETKEDYVEYLNTLTEGKDITITEVGSTNPQEKKYVVKADNASFARFTLKKQMDENNEPKMFSFEVIPFVGYTIGTELYELGEITTDIIQPITYDYTIPTSATITVNGKPLPEKAIVKANEPLFYEGHLPSDFKGDTLTSYRFTCAMGIPEISVKDAEGNDLELTEVGQDSYRYEFAYCDDEMKKGYEDYGVSFVKLLCRYTTDNCKLATVLGKVKDGSPAYKTINEIPTEWRTSAKDYTFLNIQTKNYARYSDTLYSCEVSMTYHCTYSQSKKVNDYENAYRVFFIKEKGNWLVYDYLLI